MDIGPWLVQMLHHRWRTYRVRLRECRKRPSTESIHELRVAIRRLISQFALLGALVAGGETQKPRKILKRQLEALGDLRDFQMLRSVIKAQGSRFESLVLLRDHLKRRQRRLVKATSQHIKDFEAGKVERWVVALSEHIERDPANHRAQEHYRSAALHCADKAFAVVLERHRAIDVSNLRTIHRTRVAFKKFRYIVESLPLQVSGRTRRELRRLAHYQRKMGTIQDLEVMRLTVEDFQERHPAAAVRLSPFVTYLRRRQKRAVRSFSVAADELLGFWSTPAASEQNC